MPCAHFITTRRSRPLQMPGAPMRNTALLDRTPDVGHFLRRVQSAQVQTAHSPPQILHWDFAQNNLREWAWPSDAESGERIPPSELEDHRRTHHFTAPCCLCAISLDEAHVEARIGLAVVAPGNRGADLCREYVAQCALNRCGYFVPLERFYARKVLKVKAYPKRTTPLAPEQLNYISDFESTSGIAQALPSSSIWARGPKTALRVEHPLNIKQACTEFNNLWARGVEEDVFWRLFVQCALCCMIMPRDVFSSTHGPVGCWMRREGTTWPLEDAFVLAGDGAHTSAAWASGDTGIVVRDTEFDSQMPPLEAIRDRRSAETEADSDSGDTEIIQWDEEETDDEMPALIDLEE
ncbi:hypothetical protein BKA70DRAFT_1437579 [Coprinopsis sp. MPI-PUGE-AT-0042]|nr:hypothetical protein BKA70DRAFT_1437579 [Coprinopsis sp. MPI-PUGE-AT-0042]